MPGVLTVMLALFCGVVNYRDIQDRWVQQLPGHSGQCGTLLQQQLSPRQWCMLRMLLRTTQSD